MHSPLTVDTGPDFSLDLFAAMFGHPGISALEFAGNYQKETARQMLSLKGKSAVLTKAEERPSTISEETADRDLPQSAVQALSHQQRRRGTFINHTPRNYEVCTPDRTEFDCTSHHVSGQPHASSHSSFEGGKTTSWAQPWQQLPPKAWTLEDEIEVIAGGPIERDTTEASPTLTKRSEMSAQPPIKVSVASSLACKVATPPRIATSTADSNQGSRNTRSPEHSNTGKRRRRQTPFKIHAPKSSIESHHTPLEPWIARHRRKATGSSTSEFLPKVDLDHVGEVSTFRAIQEYFDNQTSTCSSEPTRRQWSSSPPNIPLSSSPPLCFPEPIPPSSPIGPTTTFPVEELHVPDEELRFLPHSNPKSPSTSTSLHVRTPSGASLNSELASAARGEYSPYDKGHNVLVIPKKRAPSGHIHFGRAARAGKSTLGRMAPPILGHEALTATADLNDLSFYLKNTGPSLEPGVRQRKKSGLKIFKVGGKKSLAARVGSVEGKPVQHRTRPITPACAREMTTSRGTKHLRIMIPSDDLVQDQTITLPIAGYGSDRRSRHVSITWTEEMLNPLASPAVENAISGFNNLGMPSSTPTTPLRSPKRSPSIPKPIPCEDHPLLTREEQTRARKLRDLQRRKKNIEGVTCDDTVAGAMETRVQSASPICNSVVNRTTEEDIEEGTDSACKVVLLRTKLIALQRQNIELAEALATIVGYKAEDAELDAAAVLRAFGRIKIHDREEDESSRNEARSGA